MDAKQVARKLGWFSIGLGVTEVLAGRALGRGLGMPDKSGLLRFFGLRGIAAGVGILASDQPGPWVWARVAGDVLDLAALASPALNEANPHQHEAVASLAMVAGITALDIWCASRLTFQSQEPRRSYRSIDQGSREITQAFANVGM